MASSNGHRRRDKDLLEWLGEFEDMMREMVRNGVSVRSFNKHTERLYVMAAVKEAKGNYCKAGDKIGLHRNSVTRIMGTKRARAYVQAVFPKGGGQVDGE